MKTFLLSGLLALISLPTLAQPDHRYSVGIGKSEIEAWHLFTRFQPYPSGRVGVNFGYIRPFNAFLMRPWYGADAPRHTSISVEHQYFFKTKAKKVTPFYCAQRGAFMDQKHGDSGTHSQFLFTTLALGIALEMRKHWGLSLDVGISTYWWGQHNGRGMYFDDDVFRPYPSFQPEIRLQAYYWR